MDVSPNFFLLSRTVFRLLHVCDWHYFELDILSQNPLLSHVSIGYVSLLHATYNFLRSVYFGANDMPFTHDGL